MHGQVQYYGVLLRKGRTSEQLTRIIGNMKLKDSLGLYLIQINEFLEQGNPAPIEYVSPTLKQIVINNRKLKLIKKLKSDIVDDAIKNKKFEIYK